jgi:hypothetical protein
MSSPPHSSSDSNKQQLLGLLTDLMGKLPVPVSVPLSQMKRGNHRPITKNGLDKLRTSYDFYGALPESVWIIYQQDGFYEIIEGNHRYEVWKEKGYGFKLDRI